MKIPHLLPPESIPKRSSNLGVHQVAVALNNVGVTLLHSSYFALAVESFRDALQVMKLLTIVKNDPDVDVDLMLSKMMTKASERLLIPVASPNGSRTMVRHYGMMVPHHLY
jgi:hypothetical protein